MAITRGNTIKFTYELKDADGNLINSSKKSNKGPIKIQIGMGQVLKALESNLIGMKKGEIKEFHLNPEEAYGEFDPLLLEKIPISQLKEAKPLLLGDKIEIFDPNGFPSIGWIRLIEDNFIIVDMNPPLAGKKLFFKVEIIDTDLEPDPVPNPFNIGMGCENSCDHHHSHDH